MTIDPVTAAALAKTVDVAEKLGLWQKLFAKLVGDPDRAAQQLAVVLGEVRKTLGSLRDMILEIDYLGVPGQERDDVERALNRILSGDLFLDVIRAKGSCSKIGHIYERHLNAWFTRLFKPDEAAKLKELFKDLSDSDGWAVWAAEQLERDAKALAKEVKGLLAEGHEAAAKKKADALMKALRPTLEKLNDPIAVMFDLERRFIEQQRLT